MSWPPTRPASRTSSPASGTALTRGQIDLALKYGEAIALGYDVDLAGDSAAREGLLAQLGADHSVSKVRIIRIPDGKDPDELIRGNPDAWREAVADAKEVVGLRHRSPGQRGRHGQRGGQAILHRTGAGHHQGHPGSAGAQLLRPAAGPAGECRARRAGGGAAARAGPAARAARRANRAGPTRPAPRRAGRSIGPGAGSAGHAAALSGAGGGGRRQRRHCRSATPPPWPWSAPGRSGWPASTASPTSARPGGLPGGARSGLGRPGPRAVGPTGRRRGGQRARSRQARAASCA